LAGSSRGLRDRLGDLPPEAEVVAEARELLAQRFPDGVPRKMKPEAVRQLILDLCATQVLSVKELAAVLDRAPDFIRAQHIRPLVTLGLLAPQFADRPNHPNQRYQTRSDGDIPKPGGA